MLKKNEYNKTLNKLPCEQSSYFSLIPEVSVQAQVKAMVSNVDFLNKQALSFWKLCSTLLNFLYVNNIFTYVCWSLFFCIISSKFQWHFVSRETNWLNLILLTLWNRTYFQLFGCNTTVMLLSSYWKYSTIIVMVLSQIITSIITSFCHIIIWYL